MTADRIPALDGLRGVAVLLVMLYHANLLASGWVGVQLFFVLSGFLITRVLLQAQSGASVARASLHFYLRRALRIFPAYFLYLLAGLALAAISPWGLRTDAPGFWPAMIFVYNWYRAWAPSADLRWLDHLWSLSVEEQLYLLWPLLILGLRGRWRLCVLMALFLIAAVWRGLIGAGALPGLHPAAGAYAASILSPSHLDAAAAGALVCLWAPWLQQRRHLGVAALAIGALALFAGMAANGWGVAPVRSHGAWLTLGWPNSLPTAAQYVWGYSLLNLALAALLAWLVLRVPALPLLSSRVLRRVGLISYAAYLWHYPLAHALSPLVFRIAEASGWPLEACLLIWFPGYALVVFLIAAASYRIVERPCLSYARRWAAAPPATESK